MQTVHHVRDAMATRFEVWLVGDDGEHLDAVATAALDEVSRLEQLLSRFDARSEISRINRNAHREAVLVDYEVLGILQSCLEWSKATGGHFDIAARPGVLSNMNDVSLDAASRTIRLLRPDVRLDLGGYGKGYALDCTADVLRANGVTRALLHGGTSSVLALGSDADGQPWTVGLRGPAGGEAAGVVLEQVTLVDRAISTSSVFAAVGQASDIVDPHSGNRLTDPASCTVIALSAATAEVLSTALLSMGRQRAATYTESSHLAELSVAWIDAGGDDNGPRLTWFRR